MTKKLTFLLIALVPMASRLSRAEPPAYPETERTDFSETIHGVEVPDPYRWLEDLESDNVKGWVEKQAAFAENYLQKLDGREALEARLTSLWDFEKHGLPNQKAGRLFYTRNSGLQNQSVLYWREDREGAEEHVLLDPNALSEDGTVALSDYAVSDDGRYLAYGTSASGSDWQEWRVREIESGKDLEDRLVDIKFSSASWSPDSQGFVYSRYPAAGESEDRLKMANLDQKVYYHRLGESQDEDILLYQRPDQPKWLFDAFYTESGDYLLLEVRSSAGGDVGLYYRDEFNSPSEFVELLAPGKAKHRFVSNDGPVFYILTGLEAPNGRLVAVDIRRPDAGHWKEILPETENTLADVEAVGEVLIAQYLRDVLPEIVLLNRLGVELRRIPLPEIGSAHGFGGRRDDRSTFYMLTGFTNPGSIYRYDLESGESKLYWKAEVAFDPSDFETEQVFYESKDGTRVPMFLVHKKGLRRDGNAPTFLYGYGGFDISLTPAFSVSNLVWLEQGGVYAVANLRGGGEYGQAWHESGMREKKQNVFDDFIAAAEWLIEQDITKPERLAIGGGSNGGLLTAACLNQRPDLFGAVWTAVGVHDMLRFHTFTIGWAWQDEFGDVSGETDFRNLLSYSPYHNVRNGTRYPPVLITTADHDDRVYPAHSFKYGAAMQHAQRGEAPVILRIETKAGHGAGKPTAKVIEEVADRWAFLAAALGMEITIPPRS